MQNEYSVAPTFLLTGGGEIGELLRKRDWSATSIGPLSSWPSVLKTTLGIILNSRFPMFLFWGPESYCFYNEAYMPSLGSSGKHPDMLGKPGAECWPEIWHIIKPLIDQVMSGGPATWSEDQLIPIERNGGLEDAYWTFSYSPVLDELGVAGVFVTCTETTHAVKSRKELIIAEETARLCIESALLGTYERDFITDEVKTSQRLRDILCLHKSNISLDDIISCFHPDDVKIRMDAWELALKTGDIRYELRAVWPDKSIRWVQVIGKVFPDENGSPSRVLGTIKDVTEQKELISKLEASEQKFRDTVKQAPVAICVLKGENFIVELANQTYLDIVDRKEESFIGKPILESIPEVRTSVEQLLKNVYHTGVDYHGAEFEVTLIRGNKPDTCFFNFVYQASRNQAGEVTGVIIVANEVTQQVKSAVALKETELQFRKMVTQSPVAMTIWRGEKFVIEVANNELLHNIWRKEPHEVLGKNALAVFPEFLDQKYPEILAKVISSGKSHREREAVTYIYGRDKMRRFYLDLEYSPLFERGSKVAAVMITMNNVTDRVEARLKLEDAELRLRLAAEGTGLATWDLNLRTQEIIYSPSFASVFGYDGGKMPTQQQLQAHIHRSDLKKIVEPAFEKAMKTGVYIYEARVVQGDGSVRWIKTHGKVYYDEANEPERMLGTMIDITDQKLAEVKMARMAAIVETSDDAIISKTLDGIITSWNDAASRMFEYRADEVIGKSVSILIPKERMNEEPEIIKRLKSGQLVDHFETQRLKKNGQLFDVSITISPIRDASGKVVGASKIARDITRQKQVEKEIIENEEKLKIYVLASELGTWELNLTDGGVSYSDRYLEIIGVTPLGPKPVHDDLLNRLHPDDLHLREEAFNQAYTTGFLHYVTRIVWDDGSIHWVEGRGKVFYDELNEPIKIIGTLRDLTDEKKYQQELERNEQRFRFLADSMPQLIWTGDIQGDLNYFNQAIFDFSGLTAPEIQNEGWLLIVHPDDAEKSRDLWRNAINTGGDFLVEHRFKRFDGKYRWHLSRAIPQRNAMGIIELWVGTSTDIHDQKTFAQQLEKNVQERTKDLQQANYQLEQMNQELASFAYVSSHDLQEPLRKIQTFANLIGDREELSDASAEYFRRMQKAAKRMQLLIDDLLTYSRTSTSERVYERTELTSLLKEVLTDLETTILEKQAVIEVGDLPAIDVVSFQFRQLFTNLLSNSLKFARPEVPPKITLDAGVVIGEELDHPVANRELSYHRISVSDNGIGFDPVYRNRIFELFQRLHGRSDFNGTGIGLAICRKIVENHSGFITASAEPNKGATFHIFVPVNN